MAQHTVQVRRVYDEARSDQADRVLVDRVWPRGVRKADAGLDDWIKDVEHSHATVLAEVLRNSR